MKKIISIFLILAMCLSLVPQVFAADNISKTEEIAQNLKSLGIFRGVSDTEFDLGRAPTRVEALIMLVRLLGKEAEAQQGNYKHPFTDVPQWADAYVGYAYEKGLTNGISETEFGTADANVRMYLSFVLRALGYSEKENDFSYDDPFTLSYHAGILPAGVDRENFLRADCVMISYAALTAYMRNSVSTLAAKLIKEGVFTEADFLRYYDKAAINYSDSQDKELTAEEIYKKCSPAVFYIEVYNKNGQPQGSGSGFFIKSDGVAVTNYHVIENMHSAKITLSDTEEVYEVEGVYDYDIKNDWAVIKVDGSGFKTLDIGDKSTIVGGATVYAIGSPMGLQNTISQGLISNTNRVLEGVTYIQTSAAISKGSSGGAFINKYGHVIGITSAGFLDGENLGLAIPIYVVDGYESSAIIPLYEVGKQENTSQGNVSKEELSSERVLHDFIEAFYNEVINDSIAYTELMPTGKGIIETSAVLDEDGTMRVLIWEKYGIETYYFTLDLTGNDAGRIYYDYKHSGNGMAFRGTSKLSPANVTRNTYVSLDEISGNIEKKTEEAIASEYLVMGLDFINIIFEATESIVGPHTVAGLGFTNFR